MNILLDDIPYNNALYPFAAARSMVHIRCGILTILEKWELAFPGKIIISSEAYEKELAPVDYLKIPANIIPSANYLKQISETQKDAGNKEDSKILEHPWQIFEFNDWAIREDFKSIAGIRSSEKISEGNQSVCPEKIFIESGAKINFCVLNAEAGPIYIGKNTEILEGCLIRGPFAICEGSKLKMGTKIYGATTIGPHCIGGGEIKNSVMMAYSNKSHDGYLGDSVIGEWCNLGAGTSNSNLKNTAGMTRVWNKEKSRYVDAGTKCGLLMGDYSRCAINTSFNTGTVVGVCCNIFGNSFPPKYIRDFSWGNENYIFEKAIRDIENWKKLKGFSVTDAEIKSLKKIYELKQNK
ncbi:MAG: glucose-1-phosphate thymidylyltransferase [Bacteroidota bacterium]|nr:glucose-1-phosphate thymidylyltransferase [Bacteroidota bacterium]